jgi:Heparinase II/III-like protein/Heparinase II/III N-terminus
MARMGPGWLLFRARYALERKMGIQRRRFAPFAWDERPLSNWLQPHVPAEPDAYAAHRRDHAPCFFFKTEDRERYRPILEQLIAGQRTELLAEADDISYGRFTCFSKVRVQAGFPPAWHTNPLTGQQTSPQCHWTDIPDLSPGNDIKLVWELSRFAAVFKLVRAYWLTGDGHYARSFWRLVEDWMDKNPPEMGPNWMCGQEATFRTMAWVFGLHGFADCDESTPARQARLIAALGVHGARIEGNLAYARSQRNNHALSEGVGLWTIGVLFPEFRRAAHWRKLGWQVITEAITEQVYDDGAYIQHSLNYARLALHDCVWALRLARLNGHPVPPVLEEKVNRLVQLLYQLQDDDSGHVPNYGANDGALILPLNSCDYQDYRPSIAAGYYLLNSTRIYPDGPWQEDLLWLFGPEALMAPHQPSLRQSLAAEVGGYYTLRGETAWAFLRCASYQDRPAQADMLHFDFWYQGKALICDAGTYLYNGKPPWRNALAATAAHNTVMVDQKDQMEAGPRFLWYNWIRSQVNCRASSVDGTLEYFEGEHCGYHWLAHPVTHRRAVVRASDRVWMVIDDLLAQDGQAHRYDLHWLLAESDCAVDTEAGRASFYHGDPPLEMRLLLPAPDKCRFEVIRPDAPLPDSAPAVIDGWRSPYYAILEPAASVHIVCDGVTSHRYVTLLAPHPEVTAQPGGHTISLAASALSLRLSLSPIGVSPVVAWAELQDSGTGVVQMIRNT